jgi:hypothetical protein
VENVPITPGSGAKVAVDTLPTGESVQLFKLVDGTADSSTPAVVVASAVAGTEAGLVTRPIPSGTQAISVASLPLPAGAATETTLAAVNTKLGGTLAISAASLPLPASAAQDRTTAAAPAAVRLSDGASFLDPRDIADRTARLLGHVTVDNASLAVTGTFWQATQPISAASLPLPSGAAQEHVGAASFHSVQLTTGAAFYDARDISDRAARLLGIVYGSQSQQLKQTATNFNLQAELAVGGTLIDPRSIRALTSADVVSAVQSGTWTVQQGTPPWAENLTQIAGTALAAKTVPANADGQVAIPVYVNAQQYATYDVAARNIATGALTANTAKAVLSLEHGATSTKTVRIRRIVIHAIQTTALSGLFDVQITRGTAASSAGTAVTPVARRQSDPAAEVVVKSLPTITAATVADNIPAGGFGATTALYSPPVLVYDWQEAGETKPYMLRAGVLESLVINIVSNVAHNLTLTVSLDLTEE